MLATLLTQVIVDPDDPAFERPTKPVGPSYDAETAERLALEHGWCVARDGDRWRRVVASPVPREIVELNTIEFLVEGNVIVICTGGGGIPVVLEEDGGLRGIEAVVDKDSSSALLAGLLGADRLLLLTDVEGVATGWGTPDERVIRRTDPATVDLDEFAAGSMRPKVRRHVVSPKTRAARLRSARSPTRWRFSAVKAGTTFSIRAGPFAM